MCFTADFHRCPLSIPNGRLEPYCGPATDWLCDFKCADGYQIHPFLGTDRLYVSSWSYPPKRLYCENGAWLTGYENLGVAVDSVCARKFFLARKCYSVPFKIISAKMKLVN